MNTKWRCRSTRRDEVLDAEDLTEMTQTFGRSHERDMADCISRGPSSSWCCRCFIGVFSGLAVVCFRFAIDWARLYLLGTGVVLSRARMLLAPTLAGLVIAVLVMRFFPTTRGSGVNQTKAALYIYNGHIPIRTAIGKFIAAALAIGSGHSLGPEDPSLQIGAAWRRCWDARCDCRATACG